jgi:hypothetical protein
VAVYAPARPRFDGRTLLRMRRRGLLVAVVVVVLVAVLVGGRAWVRGRDYLAFGSSSRVPATARVVKVDPGAPSATDQVAVVPYRDGERVVYGLAVRNDGPLSVKVTEVERREAPKASFFMFRPLEVRMSGDAHAATRAPLPFRPFTLKPGHERYVEVIGRLGDCEHYAPGSSEVIYTQRVHFKVLGQSLTDDVALPTAIEWRYSRATRCPRERASP